MSTLRVGAQPIISSGTALIGPRDNQLTIEVGVYKVVLLFAHSEAPPVASLDYPDANTVRMTFSGRMPATGAWWEVPQIALWDSGFVNLLVIVRSMAEPQILREVSYSISQSDAML